MALLIISRIHVRVVRIIAVLDIPVVVTIFILEGKVGGAAEEVANLFCRMHFVCICNPKNYLYAIRHYSCKGQSFSFCIERMFACFRHYVVSELPSVR